MELKYNKANSRELLGAGLIVPLWNWNFTDESNMEAWVRFNRTFMELKSEEPISTIVSIISWLSVLYALNGRKVAIWILYGNEMAKI